MYKYRPDVHGKMSLHSNTGYTREGELNRRVHRQVANHLLFRRAGRTIYATRHCSFV